MSYATTGFMKRRASITSEKRKRHGDGYGKNRNGSELGESCLEQGYKETSVQEMTGPVSFYAPATMDRKSEEHTLKVRSELSRIGCSQECFSVFRQGAYLQLKYHKQIILAPPQAILSVLHKVPRGTDEAEIWARICTKIYQPKWHRITSPNWTVAVLSSLLGLAIFLGVILNI